MIPATGQTAPQFKVSVATRAFYFLIGFRNRLVVMLNWAWNFLTFRRGARLRVSWRDTGLIV
jgi:hypothetical protein